MALLMSASSAGVLKALETCRSMARSRGCRKLITLGRTACSSWLSAPEVVCSDVCARVKQEL